MPAVARKPIKKPATKTSFEYVQEALGDIDQARLSAQGEARAQLDHTTDRLHKLAGDMRTRAEDELHDLESSMDRAGEALRVEIGMRAIHAQTSVEALTKLSGELRKRKVELTKAELTK